MPAPRWDRLIETVCRRNASDLVLVPGSPPFIRMPEGLRALQVAPLDDEQVTSLATEVLSGRVPHIDNGVTSVDFPYVDEPNAWFRLMAFGHPQTRAVVISRLPPPDAPPYHPRP